MKLSLILRTALASLLSGLLFSGGCGEVMSRSIKMGTFSWISGNVSDTFQSRQFAHFLNDLLTGGGLSGGGNLGF